MGLGLDMAPGPQPGSCLVGSPLGLICLSLLLIPAAGASPVPTASPHQGPSLVPAGRTRLCLATPRIGGGPGGPPPAAGDSQLAARVLSLQLEPIATAALASAERPSSPCSWCWWASAPAASSHSSSWWSVSFGARGAWAPGPGRCEGCPPWGLGLAPGRVSPEAWAWPSQITGWGEVWGHFWAPGAQPSCSRVTPAFVPTVKRAPQTMDSR